MKKARKILLRGFVLAAMAVILAVGASAETYGDFEYAVLDNGTAEITGVQNKDITEAVIPSEIDGKRVTSIGRSAFENCKSLSFVIIPDSVTSIGADAFYFCYGLTSVTLPDSVTSIGNRAFIGSGLKSVTIPDSVTNIGDWAFGNCESLTSVTIPDSVTSIGSSAFRYTSLTSVTIPDSVTDIGDKAFYLCYGLTSVTLSDSVTGIGYEAFFGCADDFKIKCSGGSYAEQYAKDNEIPYESSEGLSDSNPSSTGSEAVPTENPATGIAVPIIPLITALSVMAVLSCKKK